MPELPAMSLEARAQQIADVSTDIAFVGNPKGRRDAVKAAALDHLRVVEVLGARVVGRDHG